MTDCLHLASDDVADLADPADYVAAVRDAYRQRGEGAPAEPRTKLLNEGPPGMFTTYAAVLPETGAMGGYMYAAGFGERDAWFMTPLFDAESGEPLALLDGASMNPYKTGAAGAVGTDALARPDASSLALIGSGAQARGQLRAIDTVRDLETVWIYSPTKEHREDFAGEMNKRLDASVAAVASSAAAIEDADIVVTATNAPSPVFDGDHLEPGTHVTAMGQYDPEKRELDARTSNGRSTSSTSKRASRPTPERSSSRRRRASWAKPTSTANSATSSRSGSPAARARRRSRSSTPAARGSRRSPPRTCSTSARVTRDAATRSISRPRAKR